jgi:hypothetical protein
VTADVPFSRPRYSPEQPGDAARAPEELLLQPGPFRDDRTWRLVWIRTGGQWRSGILTVWRQPPNSRIWLAHIRWGEDLQWGWFIYDPATIIRIPEPPAEPAATVGIGGPR